MFIRRVLNSKGFSITEMMVAAGLSGVMALLTVTFQADMKKSIQQLEDRVDFVTDTNIGLRVAWNIFGQMKPSLNNIELPDDNGKNFFDYSSEMSLRSAGTFSMSRVFTLNYDQYNSGRTAMYFLIDDSNRGAGVLYNPLNAYDKAKMGTGVIEYVSLNQGNIVTAKLQNSPDVSKRIMKAGELVLIQSPVLLKDIGLVAEDNFVTNNSLYSISRQMAFLGRVNNSATDLVKEQYDVSFKYTHPAFPGLTMGTVDDFLRYLPPSLGGGAYAVLVPVAMMRLRVVPSNREASLKKIDIYVSKRSPNGYDREMKIFDAVSSIRLLREDISTPMVKVEVVD